MATKQNEIRIGVQPPPGNVVAPDGFPADPRPKHVPQIFLDAKDIRVAVFCGEQKCSLERELDEDDPRAWSWVAYLQTASRGDAEQPVSTLRIVPPPHDPHPNGFYDHSEEPYIKLLNHAFDYLTSRPQLIARGWKGLVLTHAQVEVEGMYRKLGFVTDEKLGRWDEEGIEHLGMWKRLELKGKTL